VYLAFPASWTTLVAFDFAFAAVGAAGRSRCHYDMSSSFFFLVTFVLGGKDKGIDGKDVVSCGFFFLLLLFFP
jgi:hypothetical protein